MGSRSVAIGDLNGLGAQDLAIAELDAGLVAAVSSGGWQFAPGGIYPAGGAPVSVALGDLDGDGDLDAVLANEGLLGGDGQGATVHLNDGSATFAPAALYPAGRRPQAVAIGDLNGDLYPDVVVANRGTNDGEGQGVTVHLNTGAAVLDSAVLYDTGGRPRAVTIGDLDRDGDRDLAVASPEYGLTIHRNHGDGTFADGVHYEVGDHPQHVLIGDLDGDGDNDLAVATMRDETSEHGFVDILLYECVR